MDAAGIYAPVEFRAIGYALIGCDADCEIAALRSLHPRHSRPTTDYETTTAAGNAVRIEVVRLVDRGETKTLAALQAVAAGAEATLLAAAVPAELGPGETSLTHVSHCAESLEQRRAKRRAGTSCIDCD